MVLRFDGQSTGTERGSSHDEVARVLCVHVRFAEVSSRQGSRFSRSTVILQHVRVKSNAE